jgi:zinc transporter ZupT
MINSKSEAIRAQFVTAVAAFAGTAIGLLAERNPVFEDLLLALTGGGFLYIATVVTFPKIVGENSSAVQFLGEILMFAVGILSMAMLH